MLGRIACHAGAIYAELESKELREKVVALQGELSRQGNLDLTLTSWPWSRDTQSSVACQTLPKQLAKSTDFKNISITYSR